MVNESINLKTIFFLYYSKSCSIILSAADLNSGDGGCPQNINHLLRLYDGVKMV